MKSTCVETGDNNENKVSLSSSRGLQEKVNKSTGKMSAEFFIWKFHTLRTVNPLRSDRFIFKISDTFQFDNVFRCPVVMFKFSPGQVMVGSCPLHVLFALPG